MRLHWTPRAPPRGRILLLHGVIGLAGTWHRIGPELAGRGWDCLALDLPGHGASPLLHQPLDLPALVRGVARQLTGPIDLMVGHSLGGIVALELARRQPGVARGVVLEDPPGFRGMEFKFEALASAISSDAVLAHADPDALIQRERKANPAWSDVDVEQAVAGVVAAQAIAIVDALRGPLRWDLPQTLAAVGLPVLVLAAPDREASVPESARSALAGRDRAEVERLLPAERFVVIEGGHCLHRDAPDRWLKLVDAFGRSVVERQ